MNKLLFKILIQERLENKEILSTQHLVFSESLDRDFASKLCVFHILQNHSKNPMISRMEDVLFDEDDSAQFTINNDFVVRIMHINEVTQEQITFLGELDILGYSMGTPRLKKYLV